MSDRDVLLYQELCKSYHQIDDFRSKLLAALPVASAGSAFLLIGDKLSAVDKLRTAAPFVLAIALFGGVVTLALFCYEIYGIKKCGALIGTGTSLEAAWRVEGQFTTRPNKVVNEPLAAAVIYPAVIAGWVFLGLLAYGSAVGPAKPPDTVAIAQPAQVPSRSAAAPVDNGASSTTRQDPIVIPRQTIWGAVATFLIGFLPMLIWDLRLYQAEERRRLAARVQARTAAAPAGAGPPWMESD